MTDLAQQIAGSCRWNRTELAHQRFEVAAHEQFHDVIKGAVIGAAEVEYLDRVRRVQCGRGLGLAFESPEHQFRLDLTTGAQQLRADEFHGRSAREQAMLRFPYFAHAAFPEQGAQLVAAQLSRFAELAPDVTKEARRDGR